MGGLESGELEVEGALPVGMEELIPEDTSNACIPSYNNVFFGHDQHTCIMYDIRATGIRASALPIKGTKSHLIMGG